VIATTLVAAIAVASLAQPILRLDLPQAVAYALKHDPALLARRAQVAQAESTYAKLHAAEYPTLGGELQSQLAKVENMPGQLSQYGVSPTPEFSLNTAQVSSSWNLWDGGLSRLQAQEARRKLEASRMELKRDEDRKTVEVATAYYALANKRVAVMLAQSDRSYQQALLAIAQANERVGRVAGVDVLRAQSSEAHSEATLASDVAEADNASEALSQAIGAPLDTAFVIPDPLPEPPLPAMPLAQMIALAQKSRPEVAAAGARLAAELVAAREIDADHFPRFALNAAFGNQFSPTAYGAELASVEAINPLLAAAALPLEPLPSRGNPGFWAVGASATLGFPLADWGTRHAAHRAAQAQIDAATAALDAAKDGVELDVRSGLRTAQAALAALTYAKVAASAGEESARIAQLQYRSGLISFADVTSAQQQALSSQTALENARAGYLLALVKLRVALGTYDPVQAVSP
jgi:outer membrane protein TolC